MSTMQSDMHMSICSSTRRMELLSCAGRHNGKASGSIACSLATTARESTFLRNMRCSHQLLHKLLPTADQDSARKGKVTVKPGMPQAPTIGLHIHHVIASTYAFAPWLELQAGTAPCHDLRSVIAILCHCVTLPYSKNAICIKSATGCMDKSSTFDDNKIHRSSRKL